MHTKQGALSGHTAIRREKQCPRPELILQQPPACVSTDLQGFPAAQMPQGHFVSRFLSPCCLPAPPPFSLFSRISLPFTPSLQPSWHEACFYLAIDPPCCNMFVKTTALPSYQVGIKKKKKKKNRLCCHCVYTDRDKEQYLDTVSPLYLFHQPIPGQQ